MENKKILIVDDQKNVAMILATGLSRFKKYEVETVYNGRDTIEKCRNQFYDVVVADYQLPDMTGVEIAKTLQEISPKSKVVLITALRANMISDSLEQDNIHHFLEKPFPLQNFMDVIEEAVESVT
jgi:DNA-binding NtrC family response regulator